MKGEMKSRLALLSILLVAGLLMAAGTGSALGAGNLLKFAGKEVRVEAIGEQLKIFEDGKLVKEITIPEGEYSFTIEAAGHKLTHKIVVHKITPEENEKAQAEHEKEMSKWLEIANKDSRIQELTDGEGIHKKDVAGVMIDEDVAILTVKVEDKYYKITIDLNSETVKS
ncbi:hypothetical protein DRO53_04900, partial [Candidatus Bathyarchaeota archaeon]